VKFDSANNLMYAAGGNNNNTYFEKYTLASNGTVTKDTTRDETVADNFMNYGPWIGFDESGAVWVGQFHYDRNSDLKAYEANSDQSTWTLREITVPGGDGDNANCYAFPGSDTGDAIVVNLREGYYCSEQYWDDSAGAFDSYIQFCTADREPEGIRTKAAIQVGTTLHAVARAYSNDDITTHDGADWVEGYVGHRIRPNLTAGENWDTESTDVCGGSADDVDLLCLSTNGTDLWCVYTKGSTTIYYRKWESGTGWGSEETLATAGATIVSALTCNEDCSDGTIMVAWAEGTSSPYTVKMATLSVGDSGPSPTPGSITTTGVLPTLQKQTSLTPGSVTLSGVLPTGETIVTLTPAAISVAGALPTLQKLISPSPMTVNNAGALPTLQKQISLSQGTLTVASTLSTLQKQINVSQGAITVTTVSLSGAFVPLPLFMSGQYS
jgi:hypothetical protein